MKHWARTASKKYAWRYHRTQRSLYRTSAQCY